MMKPVTLVPSSSKTTVEQLIAQQPSIITVDFRNLLRSLVANGLATWFNDPFSVSVNPSATTTVQLSVRPQQTVLITQMRAYIPVDHALSMTIQSEGYTFWDDPDVVGALYLVPIDLVEQMMNYPSAQQINVTLSNTLEVAVNANFFFFGLTMETNVWESIEQTYFAGVIESAAGPE